MKLSIVVPSYNSEKTIIRALQSITLQKQNDFITEVIIVDDASTDNSVIEINAYIKKYNGYIVFKLLKNSFNQGVSKSRNVGMNNSFGDYIAFLDSDDSFHCEKLSIVEPILKNNSIDFLFHSFSHKNVNVNKSFSSTLVKLNKFFPFFNLAKNLICTPCVVMRNVSSFRFNESMTHMEDLELWTSIMLQPKVQAYQLKEKLTILGHVANEGEGLSANRSAMRYMESVMLSSLSNKFLQVKLLFPIYYIMHKLKSKFKS